MALSDYPCPRLATDIVILTTADRPHENCTAIPPKGLQVLLIKRDEAEVNGAWTLPGGFVDKEVPISTVIENKLKQKTGISDTNKIYKEQLYTYGDDVNRDPRDRVISVAYVALIRKDELPYGINTGDKETQWFWVDERRANDETRRVVDVQFTSVDTGEIVSTLGFDHVEIIKDAINRLMGKIIYTDIGFHLLSAEFTITELQRVYEAVLGKSMVSTAFRRVIASKIQETGKTTIDVKGTADSHRPAKIYRKNEVRS